MRPALLALLLAGCPVPMIARPALTGEVVDAASGAPIAGAEVVARTYALTVPDLQRAEQIEEVRTTTDAQGQWTLPELTRTERLLPVPEGVPGFDSALEVTAAGYRPTTQDLPIGERVPPLRLPLAPLPLENVSSPGR